MKTFLLSLLSASLMAGAAHAAQIELKAEVAKSVLPAGQKHLTHLKVGLTGIPVNQDKPRTPVNLAIVLDRSGSMNGPKIDHARSAACLAVRSLAPTDIVSIITFEQGVEILVPATKASDQEGICRKIREIRTAGGTALFAGVSKGAEEMRKFLSKESINRVILLSDGQANVGPNSPEALAELGSSLIKEGISVTTIGLGTGYNEDLMTKLAEKSDGRHAFVDQPDQLTSIFADEINSVRSVVAQRIRIEILCDPGVRPVRVLGREPIIAGQKVSLDLNQIYSQEEKYLILEVEVPDGTNGLTRDLARVEVTYDNLATREPEHVNQTVAVKFSDNPVEVENSVNKKVMISTVTQIATCNSAWAIQLRDKGNIKEAKQALLDNGAYLSNENIYLGSDELAKLGTINIVDGNNIDQDWEANRKMMKDTNYNNSQTQGKSVEGAYNRRIPSPTEKVKK